MVLIALTKQLYSLSLHDALPISSIKLRKCSSKIITSILSFISGRLATKSNQIKQLIRNGRSASLQRTFKKGKDTRDYLDRKSGSAGMPRPTSYAVFCLKEKVRFP